MRGDDQVITSGGRSIHAPRAAGSPTRSTAKKDRDESARQVTLVASHARPRAAAATWTWRVEEGGKSFEVVVVGSPNVNPGFQLVNNKDYPEIATDFAKTFEVLKSLPCDIFLGAHGGYYGMTERFARLQKGQPNPFVNPEGYKEFVTQKERVFRKTLEMQQGSAEKK